MKNLPPATATICSGQRAAAAATEASGGGAGTTSAPDTAPESASAGAAARCVLAPNHQPMATTAARPAAAATFPAEPRDFEIAPGAGRVCTCDCGRGACIVGAAVCSGRYDGALGPV